MHKKLLSAQPYRSFFEFINNCNFSLFSFLFLTYFYGLKPKNLFYPPINAAPYMGGPYLT